jgi:hypothetical protein
MGLQWGSRSSSSGAVTGSAAWILAVVILAVVVATVVVTTGCRPVSIV